MNADQLRLPLIEWVKLLGVVAMAVAPGSWYMGHVINRVNDNASDIEQLSKTVQRLSISVESLIRHDEQIINLERRISEHSKALNEIRDSIRDLELTLRGNRDEANS
jgi:septal ring factor EnvC (AmiA/AmiB activator)